MQKRLLIIRSSKQSSWGSCKAISPNLLACYSLIQNDQIKLDYFDIDEKFVKKEIYEDENYISDLAQKIKTYDPTELVFIDHAPTSSSILSFLSFYIPIKELPPLVIHIYGDFTYFAGEWINLGAKLVGHPIKFIVASESQNRLLSFFSTQDHCLETFLFPINEKEYYFDAIERSQTRSKMSLIDDKTKVILYSGRISLQKNVDVLLLAYEELFESSTEPMQLWVAGAFDDMGAHFMGVKHHAGFMYGKILNIITNMSPECAASIKLLGQQNKSQLRKLKNGADAFISLSLYHDEDYGMSPAEALACGLPSLLTDWGGYSSFASDKWNCSLVPVEITPYGHKLSLDTVKTFSDKIKNDSISQRKENSTSFLKEFSITNNAVRLSKIIHKPYNTFSGFKWQLAFFKNEYWTVDIGKEISKQLTPASDIFYNDVYRNYISGNFKRD